MTDLRTLLQSALTDAYTRGHSDGAAGPRAEMQLPEMSEFATAVHAKLIKPLEERVAELEEDDLAYLGANAFEFILNVNSGATCFDTLEERLDGTEHCHWLSREDREEAERTGVWTTGQVYPNGSVSFYAVAGVNATGVVRTCAKLCREEQARWRAQGSEPLKPRVGDDQ